MVLEMDTIQFESRWEIGAIIKALEEWQDDHGKDEYVQKLINKDTIFSFCSQASLDAHLSHALN